MGNEKCYWIFGWLYGIGIGMLIGNTIGKSQGIDVMRQKAINVSVAEYYLDKDDIKQFRWKTDTSSRVTK